MRPSKGKGPPNRGLIAILAILAVGLGAGGYWVVQGAAPAAGDEAEAANDTPTLPTGRLLLLEKGVTQARFLALDEIKPAKGVAGAAVLVVGRSAKGLEGAAAMTIQRKSVDCARGRVIDGPLGYFDFDGRSLKVETFYSGRHGRPPAHSETEVTLVCAPSPGAGQQTFKGFRAAQRELQSPPDDYEKLAATRPDDPLVWAWLCSAGARGRWRETTPGDCDRAVKLDPTSSEVGLDRAFLNLRAGKQAIADAAFRNVLTREPNNPTANFGRSLLLAMRGEKAQSAKYRTLALASDPAVPHAVEARYGFYISPEYKQP